jgi:3-methyl-2-oxobutanoate hydroxymethyltransferase
MSPSAEHAARRPASAYNRPTMPDSPSPLANKFTLTDLRAVRKGGAKVAMLTCYDYTTARLMHQAGVPILLVGDSAGAVILGYENTLSVKLDFLIELTAAVRRGAPNALLVGDMPFGSYQGSVGRGVRNVCRMVQLSHCDCVKLEVAASHVRLVRELADAGVAVMAHVGLRPQAVGVLGGYRTQGRTADQAMQILELAKRMEDAGASAILLEAVPPEVSRAVVDKTSVPIIGCGAGAACHANVVVVHDLLGLTPQRPKFVPALGELAGPASAAIGEYVRQVSSGKYPGTEHQYSMPEAEKSEFLRRVSS